MQAVNLAIKVNAVNQILDLMGTNTTVERMSDGWYCTWVNWRGETVKRRYSAKGNWPVWGHKWGHGGTRQSALNQLMRWLQGKSVYPLRVWRHWVGENVKLGATEIINILIEAGYPEHSPCIFCGQPLVGAMDWFNTPNGDGPGHFNKQCTRQSS